MTSFHSIFGLVVAAAFLAVAALGWWRWRRFEPSDAFWGGLRAGQVLYGVYLAIAAGGVFLGGGARGGPELGFPPLPLAGGFMGGGLRVSSAAGGLAFGR